MTYDPDQLNRTSPSYLSAYGLTESPFSEQHDDRFLYLNSSLNERLELLKHYTQYGNLLLLITGERGIGKSSLKQRFTNTAHEEWQVCEIQSHTMMDASLLLRQVANGFNITEPPLDPSALFEVLSEQLEYMHQASLIPILIIDDAHELPQDALQALLYLAEHHSNQETALRIILFCEPEIETMLEDPAIHSLKDRVTHNMEIPPLDEMQTAEYLRHRLAVAGFDGTSPFTPKLVNKIFKASNGIPSRINDYAHQNLLDDTEPFVSDERDLDDEMPQQVTPFNFRNILIAGLALIIVIPILIFQDNINQLFEETEPEIILEAESSPPIIQETKINKENIIDEIKVEEKTIVFNLNEKATSNTDAEEKNKEENTGPVKNEKEIHLMLSSINPNPVPTSKQRQIVSISGEGFHKGQKVKVSWTGKEKILADTQVNITSSNYMNLILNTGMKPDTWTVTVIDTLLKSESNTISFDVVATGNNKSIKKETIKQEPKVVKSKPEISLENGLYGQSWIKQQNKNHFTLQLLGTHNRDTLPLYLKKFGLKNDAAIFETTRNNKDWFTLIYGQYPSKSDAQTAVKNLPKNMVKPWVRTFASILPSLNENSQKESMPVVTSSSSLANNKEGWLWSQDPSHYTLQLAAGANERAIQSFVKRHNLKDKAVYFHRLRDGKDWYILVYGGYTGYSLAKQSITKLPTAVQKSKPWIRTFGAIHAELN